MQRVANLLNHYEQFTTTIDGVDIHFLRVRSPVMGATPCIMTHGWPGSLMEFVKVIDALVDPVGHGGEASDALELVVPSLPGYGWSGKPTVTGWNVEKIARAWIELMDRLGYERWVAQGGDWGALVSAAIGRLADPAKLIGIHVNHAFADPAKLAKFGGPNEEEQRYLALLQRASEGEGGYAIEQATKPQTLGYGLTDSPVGQLAWIVEKFKTWSDCGDDLESSFTKDELLDNVMVYWLNAAATSSARLYWHSLASIWGASTRCPRQVHTRTFPQTTSPCPSVGRGPASPICGTTVRRRGAVISPRTRFLPSLSPRCARDSAP